MGTIVLNERAWAEDALLNVSIGDSLTDALSRISRYYYSKGYEKKQIARMLDEFLIRCDPSANLTPMRGMVDAYAQNSDKRPLLELDGIRVSKRELDTICEQSGVMARRLLFTLLCLAKYANAINPKNNNWVSREFKEVFTLANIQLSMRRKSLLINDLWRAGLIEYSRIIDNLNVNVLFIDGDDTDCAIEVSDFRNLGNQLMQHLGERYITCKHCGAVVKQTGNRQLYCRSCAATVNLEKTLANRRLAIGA